MRVGMSVNFSDFSKSVESHLTHVARGTKKATKAACEEILKDSLAQVPRQTSTLAMSAFYEIMGSYRNFEALIGYGGNGDPINPITGQRASQYMVAVHEDLYAYHPIGKAKYLEDPIRAWALERFPRTIIRHLQEETGR